MLPQIHRINWDFTATTPFVRLRELESCDSSLAFGSVSLAAGWGLLDSARLNDETSFLFDCRGVARLHDIGVQQPGFGSTLGRIDLDQGPVRRRH